METVFAFIIGILYAAAFYLLLRRSIVKLAIGLVFLTHASNLLIFTASGLTSGKPPLGKGNGLAPQVAYADPLPQALILTAIVISFGVLAFTIVLVHRAHQELQTDDLDKLRDSGQ